MRFNLPSIRQMVAALSLITATGVSAGTGFAATAGQTFAPLNCPAAGSTSNCNAQDVNTVSYTLNTELDTCTGPADTGRSIININYTQNARRYNITSINSVSGQAVAGGSQCGETFLSADQGSGNYSQQATIEYKCVDNNGNGTIDVAAVFNWSQTSATYVDPVVPTGTATVTTPKCTSLGFVDIQGLYAPYSFAIEKSAPSPALKVSQESDYTLTVLTTGTAVAAEVKEQLPAGLTYVSATGTDWSCSVDGSNLVTCSKASMSDGTAETITVKVKPDATVSGQSVTNYVSAGSPGSVPEPGLSCTTFACDSDTSTVSPAAFTMSKSAPSPALAVGGNSVYTLTVTTDGTSVPAQVKDQLPAGLTFVSATGTDWNCSVDGSNLVTCDKASISTGTPEAISVTVTPTAASVGQSVTNYASAGPDGAAPAPGPTCTTADCDSDTSDVADATFTMSKSSPSPTLKVGENSIYTLTVTTDGDGVAAEVKDQLPAGLTYVSATGTDWNCSVDGSNLVTCSKASISTGTPEAISVTVAPTAASVGQSVTNYASAGLDGAAPTPGPTCTTADCDSDISDVADATFTMDKSAPSPALKVGANSVYTLTVTTDGAGVAAQVKDQLPAGLTYVSATGTDWNCSVDGSNLVTCDKASISTGTPEAISVTVTPTAASVGQSVTNYASAGLDGAAPTPGPTCTTADCDSDTSDVADATFTMSKSAPSPALKVGENSIYTLTVTTDGADVAAQAKDQLPAGLTFVSATGTDWNCSVDGSNLVTCDKASISTGTPEAISVTVAPTAASVGQSVTNYASAGPDGAAPAPGPSCTTADCDSDTSNVDDATFTMDKSAPSPALKVGANSVYTLTVTTDGAGVAAQVKDQLPAGLTYVSATGTDWNCSVDGSNLVTCDKASISTGTPEAISVTVTPTAASVGQSVTNYASAGLDGAAPTPGPSCTTADCDSDTSSVDDATFTMDKSAPSPALKVGTNSVYTLTVTTDGAGVAAQVKDQLPAGFTYVSATGTDWNCSVDGSNLVTCDKASISTGTPEAISVTVTPTAASVGQSVTNYASAGPDGAAPTPGPTCTTADCDADTSAVADATFTMDKSAPSPALKVGTNSVYTLTVTTDGAGVAAQVKDQLPAGLTFVSATGTDWSCSVDGSNLVTCDKASISTGTSETISVTVTPTAASVGQSVTNYASAGIDGAAPAPGPSCTTANCDSDTSAVADPTYAVTKSAPSPGLKVGSQSVYTLTVTTDGDGVAAEVKDQLPTGLTYVSATGTGWNCSVDGSSLVTCNKASISTSTSEEIAVTVVTEASALGQDLTNYASAGPDGAAPEPGPSCDSDDCDSSSAEVAPAGYTLAKSAPVPQLQVHRNSVYTLTVTTDGVDVPAEVKDQLPAGLTYVSATGTGWSCAVDGSNLVTCNKTISSGAPEQIAVTVTTGETLNAKNVTNYASAGPAGAAPQPTSCTPSAGVACANNASTVADIREEIKKAVEDDVQAYLGARLDQLIGSFDSQSRLQRFRNTQCGVSHDLSLNGEGTSHEQNIAANGTFSMKGGIVPTADVPPEQCSNVNIWAQLDVGYVDGLEDSSATGGMVTVGAEYLITDNFLAGARLSMDYTDASFDSDANSDISGYGWLAGPYISAELANNLFLDGFIGYGTSWNDYGGNYEGLDLSGDFTTQRIAGYLNLSGTWQTGAVLLTPLLGVSYGKEWSDSFSVSNDVVGNTGIDGQDAELGRLKGRIEAGYLVSDYADERLELFLAPQVTYDFVRNAGPEGDQLLGDGLWRGGLEGGFRFSKDQFGASLIVGYDGVGVSDWNAYRGQLQLNYTW